MRVVGFALLAGLLQPPAAVPPPAPPPIEVEIDARFTRMTSPASGIAFDNPALHLTGTIAATASHRLQIIEITLGETPIDVELSTFRLVTAAGDEFTPIAVGGRPDTLFPAARLPLDQEVGQILPSNAILAVTRHGEAARGGAQGEINVTLEAGPNATLAFLYDIPQDAAAVNLKLPNGRLLPLQ